MNVLVNISDAESNAVDVFVAEIVAAFFRRAVLRENQRVLCAADATSTSNANGYSEFEINEMSQNYSKYQKM